MPKCLPSTCCVVHLFLLSLEAENVATRVLDLKKGLADADLVSVNRFYPRCTRETSQKMGHSITLSKSAVCVTVDPIGVTI
jgi:hypothetical protein